jgi:glycyl-tRNA synthetase alpha subunit
VRRQEEYEHSKYYFEIGNVERLRQMYDLYKARSRSLHRGRPGAAGA